MIANDIGLQEAANMHSAFVMTYINEINMSQGPYVGGGIVVQWWAHIAFEEVNYNVICEASR